MRFHNISHGNDIYAILQFNRADKLPEINEEDYSNTVQLINFEHITSFEDANAAAIKLDKEKLMGLINRYDFSVARS